MGKPILLSMVLVFALTTAASSAEPLSGLKSTDRARSWAEEPDEAALARHSHAMAKCVVSKRRSAAERLLAAATPEQLVRAHRLAWSGDLDCYTGFGNGSDFIEGRPFETPLDIERGLFAEQLLQRMDRQSAALSPLPLRQQRYQRAWFGGTDRNLVINEMSACLADTAPSEVRAVLGSRPYTESERSAFVALTPMMTNCLSAGAKLVGNRHSIRAALADALYQRVINPAASIEQVAEPSK